MTLIYLAKRITFYGCKAGIVMVSWFSHRLYMKLYIPLLKSNGMKFTGIPRFIGKDSKFDDFSKIELGDRVVISNNVYFLTHDYSYTTALIATGGTPATDIAAIRGIRVGNNVFIGMGSLILPGTEVGDNVIIGAGSVVRGVIPSGSVVAGNPAKVLAGIDHYADKWNSGEFRQHLRADRK